jgi:hypothetical protein
MTTTYQQLVNDIVTATARPDLVNSGDVDLAIRRATLKLHSMAFWPMDLAEAVITFKDNTQVVQSINIANNLPYFRAIKYIRENLSNAAPIPSIPPLQPYQGYYGYPYDTQNFFNKMEPDAILDDYNLKRNNVWYLGGTNINLNCRMPIGSVTVGWYQHPVVSNTNYQSWLADAYPFAISDEAARIIFASTGYLDMAKQYDQICAEHRQYLLQNFIDGEGR